MRTHTINKIIACCLLLIPALQTTAQPEKQRIITPGKLLRTGKYFSVKTDINKDGVPDLVVSSKQYAGDELYFFVNTSGRYRLALKSTNYSADGGRIIDKLVPVRSGDEVLKVLTYFPDRGTDKAAYYIGYKHKDWILTRTVYNNSYSESTREIQCECNVQQGIWLKDLLDAENPPEIKDMPEEKERSKKCRFRIVSL